MRVLVTGAGGGFGRVIVKTLARKGHTVVASMRDLQGRGAEAVAFFQEMADKEGLAIEIAEIDVTEEKGVCDAIERLLSQGGALDAVIQNAGVAAIGWTEAFSSEEIRQIFEVNVFGAQRVARAVLPSMRQRRSGVLIHLSSGAGRLVFPGMGVYCASKAALESYAEALRYELSSTGVDSVILQPGAFPTDLVQKRLTPGDHERSAAYHQAPPLPEQIVQILQRVHTDPWRPPIQHVADAVLRLLETPTGQRPLRTLVPAFDPPLQAINAAASKAQTEVLTALGFDRSPPGGFGPGGGAPT